MLRVLSIVGMCAALLVFLTAGAVYGAPKVRIDNSGYDAGDIPQGKEISHEFTIENIGDAPLSIQVKPCWGVRITAPGGQNLESQDQTIAPGQNLKLLVSMSTQGYAKTLNKKIKIQTNDPDSGLVTLTMSAQILELLSVSPRMMDFGKVLKGSVHTRELTIANTGREAIAITGVSAKPDNLIAIAPAGPFTLGAGEERRLALTLTTGSSKGHTGGYVSIETTMEYLQKKIVRVRAQVVEKNTP